MNEYLHYLKSWTKDNLLFAWMAYGRAAATKQRVSIVRTNAAIHPLRDRPNLDNKTQQKMLEDHCKFLQHAFGGSSPPADHSTWTVTTQHDMSNYATKQRGAARISRPSADLHSKTAYIDPPVPDSNAKEIAYEAFFKAHKSFVETEMYIIQTLVTPTFLPVDVQKHVHVEKQLLEETASSLRDNNHGKETVDHQFAQFDIVLRCIGERTLELQRPCRADILQRSLAQYFPNPDERNTLWHTLETSLIVVQDVIKTTAEMKGQRSVHGIADLLSRRAERAGANNTERQKAYQATITAFMSLLSYVLRPS